MKPAHFSDRVQKDFPLLQRRINRKSLVYLDNASTTQKPRVVLDMEREYYEMMNANIHRGLYTLSEEATAAYEAAHAKTAEFLHAKPDEIIFTKNATESLNLLAYSLTKKMAKGDAVSVSLLEHHSNFVPWQQLARERQLQLNIVGLQSDGTLNLDMIDPKAKIISVSHVSNVLGTIAPLRELAKRAKEQGALFIVDASQSAPHFPLDVSAIDCDFLAFSSHKIYGPTGIGVLHGKRYRLEMLDPFLYGGDMIREVTLEKTTFNDLPWKFEAGTPNIAGGIGFGVALEYVQKIGFSEIQNHEAALTRYALDGLRAIPGVTVYGPDERGPVISFTVKDIHPHDLAAVLSRDNVCIRGGHHCAMPLMHAYNVSAMARVSFGLYNSAADVDQFLASLRKAIEVFR